MNKNDVRFLLSILFVSFSVFCISQDTHDSLKIILSSPAFTIEEEYIGDWGGHVHVLKFKTKDNNAIITWENPDLKQGKLKVILNIDKLEKLKQIFIDCSAKVQLSKIKGTEHIFYKFKNKNMSYTLDDKFTMECNNDFRDWKDMILLAAKKQHDK